MIMRSGGHPSFQLSVSNFEIFGWGRCVIDSGQCVSVQELLVALLSNYHKLGVTLHL